MNHQGIANEVTALSVLSHILVLEPSLTSERETTLKNSDSDDCLFIPSLTWDNIYESWI